MLTVLIVKLYKWLVELMLWVFIVAGGIAASRMDLFSDISLNDDWFIDKQVVGFVSGALAAFFVAAIIFGAVLILIEIQKSLRRIETQLERRALIQKEPALIPPPSSVVSSVEKVQLQQVPDPIPRPIAASAAAENVPQRVSRPRQKRKPDGMPGHRPIQESDKSGPDGERDSGTP